MSPNLDSHILKIVLSTGCRPSVVPEATYVLSPNIAYSLKVARCKKVQNDPWGIEYYLIPM